MKKNKKKKNFGIVYFIRFKIPSFFLLQSLYIIVFIALSYAFVRSEFDKIYIPLLSIIGFNVSLASCTFAYSKIKKGVEKDNLIKVGEHFLFATISTIESIIFTWIASKLKQLLPDKHWHYQIPSYFIYLVSQLYLWESIETFNKGLNYLYRNLFFEVDI